LPLGSQSYVMRCADDEIAEALLSGEFVFVLDSRQKGKSSLIVRSLHRLSLQGVTSIRVDLQRLGANLSAEQWYAGLLHSIGQDLGLTAQFFDYWKENLSVGPMTRWFAALEHVVLHSIPGPIVIFIDEVDYVQSLPFSSDEFFAGVRGCYNRRSTSPEFRRITFCLAGVASPAQLIQNEDVTPFNVGKRVELTDFTRNEIEPYAERLSISGRNGKQIVDRIFYWVNGHPYLTQLIAAHASADDAIRTSSDVDKLVRKILLRPDAREQEPNIADTERRLLAGSMPGTSSEEHRNQVLELHRLLLKGDVTAASQDGALISTVLLSGVAIENNGKIQIRNRLYRTLFDEDWRRNSLPDAEVRRQRSASARATWKVACVSLAILTVMVILIAKLLVLTQDRNRALAESRRLNGVNMRSAYEASIALAWERVEDGNYLKAFELVDSQRKTPGRNWEWGFLTAVFDEAKVVRRPDRMAPDWTSAFGAWREGRSLVEIKNREIRRDGRLIALAPAPPKLVEFVWWLRRTRKRGSLNSRLATAQTLFAQPESGPHLVADDGIHMVRTNPNGVGFELVNRENLAVTHVATPFKVSPQAFSGDGKYLTFIADDMQTYLYDTEHLAWLWHKELAQSGGACHFSPDCKYMMVPRISAEILIVRTEDGSTVAELKGHSSPATDVEWFSDSKRMLSCSNDGSARVWNAPAGKQLRVLVEGRSAIQSADLNIDERSVMFRTQNGAVLEWNLDSLPPVQTLAQHSREVLACIVSPNGKRCATSSSDGSSVLLDMVSTHPIGRFQLGVPARAHPICFSPDGSILALVGTAGEVLIIDPADGRVMRRFQVPGRQPRSVAISKGGAIALAFGEGGIFTLADWHSEAVSIESPKNSCNAICFSTDGKKIALGTGKGDVGIVDLATHKFHAYLEPSGKAITHVEFSSDDKWLSASSHDFCAYLFALDGSGKRTKLSGHWGRVWSACFSPDGKRLLTNSIDGTARVWDVETGRQLSLLQHGSWVASARWSRDGKRVLTACFDKYVRVFDPNDGFELLKLSGHQGAVLDAVFTPDGKTMISAGEDHMLRLWRANPFSAN